MVLSRTFISLILEAVRERFIGGEQDKAARRVIMVAGKADLGVQIRHITKGRPKKSHEAKLLKIMSCLEKVLFAEVLMLIRDAAWGVTSLDPLQNGLS